MIMMRKEIKTAIIGAIIIVIAIGGLAVFFTSLDKTVASTGNQITIDKTNTGNSSSAQTTYSDESNYPKAPDLVGISGYINTTPEIGRASCRERV